MKTEKQILKDWYKKIGSLGGKKSKRAITPEQQEKMQASRGKNKQGRKRKQNVHHS